MLKRVIPSCSGPILNESAITVSNKVQFYKHLLGDYSVICEVLSMSRQTQVQIPALPFTSCVTLGSWNSLSFICSSTNAWYCSEDGMIWFFNSHSKWLIPCFPLMCVNWIDSICEILSRISSKRTNEITSTQYVLWSLSRYIFCFILLPSIVRLWSRFVLRLKIPTVQLKNSGSQI